MDKKLSIVLSCFKDSFFLRGLLNPESIGETNQKEKTLLESMVVYQEDKIMPISRRTNNGSSSLDNKYNTEGEELKYISRANLKNITFKDGKYYLEGSFVTREDKSDAFIYPSFESVFNSNTRLGVIGSYETVAFFQDDTLKFQTDYAGYRTIIGGNLDGASIHDMLFKQSGDVVKNYVERVSGSLDEEFIYDLKSDMYFHKSTVSKDIEELVVDENHEHPEFVFGDMTTEEELKKKPKNMYAFLKNERERLIREASEVPPYFFKEEDYNQRHEHKKVSRKKVFAEEKQIEEKTKRLTRREKKERYTEEKTKVGRRRK